MIIQRTLLEATDIFLVSKHRFLVQDWSYYLKAQKKLEKTKAEPRLSEATGHQTKQESRPREATSGNRKSGFSEELTLVTESLQSFAKMVRLQKQTFSHK